jgi:hypothetical protein
MRDQSNAVQLAHAALQKATMFHFPFILLVVVLRQGDRDGVKAAPVAHAKRGFPAECAGRSVSLWCISRMYDMNNTAKSKASIPPNWR